MNRARLSEADIEAKLGALPGWRREGEALARNFEFEDFVGAFGFMASAALVAERMNHHPDWSNVYRRVSVALSTHDAGGITELDFALAAEMSRIAGADGAGTEG